MQVTDPNDPLMPVYRARRDYQLAKRQLQLVQDNVHRLKAALQDAADDAQYEEIPPDTNE